MKKVKYDIPNDVVIVGEDGKNTLGILREFGECGKIADVIMIQKKIYKDYVVTSSKYGKRVTILDFDDKVEKNLINLLIEKGKILKEKAILITTTDLAVELVDKHFEELREYFLLSNINNKNNGIIEYLNKYSSYVKLTEAGANLAHTEVIDLTKIVNMDKIKLPCILKPKESAHGKKSDITICNSHVELEDAINYFKNSNYQDIVVQEYLDYDYEFSMHGYVTPNHVYIPGVMTYLHKQIIGTNDYSYMKYVPKDEFEAKEEISKFCEIIKKIGYTGPFAAEHFYCNGKVLINEINFRTDDCSYNEVPSGHYVLVEYAKSLAGYNPKTVRTEEKNNSYYISLTFEMTHLLRKHKLGFFEMIREVISSKSFEILSLNDCKPFFTRLKRWVDGSSK